MGLRKRNICVGVLVACFAILLYLVFLLITADTLVTIGNRIEGVFGACSDFNVEVFREGVKTITSGVFVSALVAVLFYLQEYSKIKKESVRDIIALGREICKKFEAVPTFEIVGEEAKLKKACYLEEKQNKRYSEMIAFSEEKIEELKKKKAAKKIIDEIEERIDFFEKRKSDKAKNKLTDYWKKNRKDKAWIDNALFTLVPEYDERIQRSKSAYMSIMALDLSALEELVNNYDSSGDFSKKKISLLNEKVKDKSILGNLSESNFNSKDIAKRILIIYKRAKECVENAFKINSVDIERASNEQLLDVIIQLQPHFIKQTKVEFYGGIVAKPLTIIEADYSVMKYHMENLFSILTFSLSDMYSYAQESSFIRPAQRYYGNVCVGSVVLNSEETLNMLNIYR